ncbi:peptidyl-tRNA hydrolase ICT1, mitochondrial isoform X2 [Alosa sapidissima]|uniref:peptidyl-tRNA hydrolase ICT1, mitochondrial isoform X2 n=1 Tax=Alosa sapidissima TaxID=34773 RepID=UPI001C09B08D|nr:peptidyl-tRNA hydrolase ICT1, mitochondrial isoform X2 [Alosa sapidissima]
MFLVRQFGHKAFIFNKTLPFQCRLSQSFPYGSSRSSDNDRDQDQSGLVDIPIDRLKISYSRSSGPGGQHVNKVNSKAEVRFHVQTADWISAEVRTELLQRFKTRVNKAGELVVTSEVSRSQHRNLADCVQKIRHMISEASYTPPEPSEEDLVLRAQRLEKRDQERLKQKKLLSALKKSRRMDFD